MRIEIHNLFQFDFHEVILVLWPELHVWQVNLDCLFRSFLIAIFFQLHHSILDWLGIKLHNLFWYAIYRVIMVSYFGSWIWHVNRGWLKSIQHVVILILKKMSFWIFLVKLCFYGLYELFLDPQSQPSYNRSIFT